MIPLDKKRNIIFIVGSPGSGKSYLAMDLSEEDDAVIVDDPKDFSEIEKAIKTSSRDVIIADCFLCEEEVRLKAEQRIRLLDQKAQLVWYFFEKNPEQCRKNVELRNDGRKVEGSIKRFSSTYCIPSGVKTIPVWR